MKLVPLRFALAKPAHGGEWSYITWTSEPFTMRYNLDGLVAT